MSARLDSEASAAARAPYLSARVDAGEAGSSTPAVVRLGFLGVGWIGRHRLEAVARSGVAEVAAIADPSSEQRVSAGGVAPLAARVESLEELLALELDGVVIATPSALHAEQSLAALESGLAVFCQKPLGRSAAETRRVVDAAAAADRLLALDLSYRYTMAMAAIRERLRRGEIGRVFAADLVFHNAYGPDKPWYYDHAASGGGCVMDLGIHLVDLALWTLGFPPVEQVSSRLFAGGRRLGPRHAGSQAEVEDYASARLDLAGGATAQVACSWRLSAGQDAVISATFYGTEGALALRNLDGSFYDFVAERWCGTARERIVGPPDQWGGRAVVEWATRLARGERFDPAAEQLVRVAEALDSIYANG